MSTAARRQWRAPGPGPLLGAALALGCVDGDALFAPIVLADSGASGAGTGSSGGPSGDLGGAGGREPAVGGTGAGGMGGAAGSRAEPELGGGAAPVRPDAGAPCDPCPCAVGAFGAPEVVTGLGVPGDLFGPAFSADARTLFFSALGADESIYAATREDRSASFSSATLVPNIDAGGTDEGTPFLTFEGLALYFFSTRPGPGTQGDRDLWVSERAALDADFGEPRVVPAVNGAELDHLPRLSRDELTLAFVSGRPSDNDGSNIWVAQREDRDGAFGPAVELPGVNTDSREEGFSLSADGLTLYFASDRIVPLDMDLWVATRPDLESPFEEPQPLQQLNTNEQELDPALSPDGFELFFSSTRNGAAQLFRSARICPP